VADTRTTRQIVADKLDLEIFRLVRMVENFAEVHAIPKERACFYQAAREISAQRFHVRKYMHKSDQEASNAE